MKQELLNAHTFHKRIGGPDNAFRYSVDYVISEPDVDLSTPGLMSRNRFNLAAIYDQDHGGERGKGRGTAWVRDVLRDQGLGRLASQRILLLAQPRILGFVFNPVSFWLIVDENDALRAVIAEVNITFGDRHSYLCHHDDLSPIAAADTLVAQKVFHVSPFQTVEGTYAFRFDYAPTHIGVRIDYRRGNGGLLATLVGKRRTLTSRAIIFSVIRRPFGSLRVVFLILMQAMILRLKGAQYHDRPEPPEIEVTR